MTFDSQLIEDYLQTEEILIDNPKRSAMAIFPNRNGESEALVISKNSQGNDELYHVAREPLSDSGWNMYGVGAYATAIAVADSNTLWAVGTDNQFWQNRTSRWDQQIPALPDGAKLLTPPNGGRYLPISGGIDGTVRTIDTQGRYYEFHAGQKSWQKQTPPYSLSQAPVGRAGSLWALIGTAPNIQVVREVNGDWQLAYLSAGMPVQVAVAADDTVWAVDGGGSLYQYVNQQWQKVTGTPNLSMIAVTAADNIWALSPGASDVTLMHFDGKTWQPVSAVPAYPLRDGINPTAQISVAVDGTVWLIDGDGIGWKYRPNAGGKWQRQMMPTGMSGFTASLNVSAVVAGEDNNGVQAFYTDTGVLLRTSLSPSGVWRNVSYGVVGFHNIGITTQVAPRELIVYGVNGSGNVVWVSSANSYRFQNPSSGTILQQDAALQINALTSGAWYTAAMPTNESALYVAFGNSQNPINPQFPQLIPVAGNGAIPLKQLIPIPYLERFNQFYSAVVSTDGNVYLVCNITPEVSNQYQYSANFIPLTGPQASVPSPIATPIQSTSALVDADQNLRIYATDANGKLWVTRQIGSNLEAWTGWHPLGNDCKYLANGPGHLATRELFTLDASGFLSHLTQDAITKNWKAKQIHKPTGTLDDPTYVSQYQTEIAVWNETGGPAASVAVTVSVVEPVSIWVHGVQYNLDASHPATFQTDLMGKISINTLALDLHTAQLTFSAESLDRPYAVYPPQNVQDRLAKVSGDDLKNATVRTDGFSQKQPEPLVITDAGKASCDSAASAMNDTFQLQTQQGIHPGQPPTPSQPLQVVQIRPAASAAAGTESIWNRFWHDLANFAEDFWNGIRNGILTVEKVVKKVGEAAIEVTVSLAEAGIAVFKLIVKTMDDVVHAVASAFRWIGAEVAKAIDWLKEFFSWGDILNTKTVIEYCINQVYGNLITDLAPNAPGNVQQFVSEKFDEFHDKIVNNFQSVKQSFEGKSFTGTVRGLSVDPKVGPSVLQPDAAKGTYHAHQVKCNYAHRKTNTYIAQGGSLRPGSGGAATMDLGSDPFGDFLDFVSKHLDLDNPDSNYNQAQARFQTKMLEMQKPKDFFDTAVEDFLTMVEDLLLVVLALLKEIVLRLLDLASASLTAFQKLLNHEIHIPIISYIYEKIAHHPLTILDLLCLILAIPATLLYKLIKGGAQATPPFTTEEVQTIISQKLPWPKIPTSMPTMALAEEIAVGSEPSSLSVVQGILGLLTSIPYAILDAANDSFSVDTEFQKREDDAALFMSLLTLLTSSAAFVWNTPFNTLEKGAAHFSATDKAYVATWSSAGLGLIFNVVSVFGSGKKEAAEENGGGENNGEEPKPKGPIVSTVIGLGQLAAGIAFLVEYIKDKSDRSSYNAAYPVSVIITPVPTIGKFLLRLPKDPALTILVILDLICDVASGACTLAEDI